MASRFINTDGLEGPSANLHTAASGFFAHSSDDPSKSDWHLLRDHLIAAGDFAASFAAPFGATRAARLAGLLHDLGKYSQAFQEKISNQPELRVDHATAGAQEVQDLAQTPRDRWMTRLIAYAIAGHHVGLADWIGDGSLRDRLTKSIEPLENVWRNELTPDANNLLPEFDWDVDKARMSFQISFLGRMIFSCLVDGDYRDTENFYRRIRDVKRDRDWHRLEEVIDDLLVRFDNHMEQISAGATQSEVNHLRTHIRTYVRAKASESTGFFTLTVPTGGGKTLTSLGFALDHAKVHGLSRIIYAIPFTSVIDQTASVFRSVLGQEAILEHHSAIDEEKLKEREQREKLQLAMEDWAAPIVVTTNVQLFESLFAHRPARCRKLHNIANSVIVLDEAQTIPRHLLLPTMEAMRELTRNYGCTFVLCTATQPALGAPGFRDGLPLSKKRELAPNPSCLAKKLKRTTIDFVGDMTDDDLITVLKGHSQALVIVNSRKHALSLYQSARDAGLGGLIHLTTRQCAADRREILADVWQRLESGRCCLLIATSLVEAGVDLDFPRVWRAEAGLDQIAQAAGRCNREGKYSIADSVVTVFTAPDNPPPAAIKGLTGDFARMRNKHNDLLSPSAIDAYFGEVYWRMDDKLDAEGILNCFNVSEKEFDFSYRTAARNFRMIRSGMVPIIIKRDEAARDALQSLKNTDIRPGGVARKLQPYIVQIPPRARNLLLSNGHANFEREDQFGDQFCALQTEDLYTSEVGLLWENAEYLAMENMVI